MSTPTTIESLRNEVLQIDQDLRDGRISYAVARSLLDRAKKGLELLRAEMHGRPAPGRAAGAKETKTRAELQRLILDELAKRGFPGVKHVALYRVIDRSSSPFSWEVSVVSLGSEPDAPVRSALFSFQRSLQERYDLLD